MEANTQQPHPIIGLVPAAGLATRIAPLPCSKEVLPVGLCAASENNAGGPKVVGQYLLEKMEVAGAQRIYIVLRKGKWDIPAYFGDGHALGVPLGYLVMRLPYGVAYTLNQAFPFVQDARVLLGFPDILFTSEDAYRRLLDKQAATGADVVLGLFPAPNPQKADMVAYEPGGRVRDIVVKPDETDLTYAWVIAVWTPTFSKYLHTYLTERAGSEEEATYAAGARELHIGQVVQAAMRDGLDVQAVPFPEHTFLDIGTPNELARVSEQQW